LLSRIQEADKKIIELHDDDNSEAIIPMLKHIYGLSYENQELTIEDNSAAILHLAVFMLGDKYDISSLRAAAAKLFNQILVEESQTVLGDGIIYAISKLLGPQAPQLADEDLMTSTIEFVFARAATFMKDETFCRLLANGVMFDQEDAFQFLCTVGESI
jgi:hypothetical protein